MFQDWPITEHISKVLPPFFNDFYNAVPARNFTSYTGKFNLASYIPQTHNPPDLGNARPWIWSLPFYSPNAPSLSGPKLYAAFVTTEDQHGTTRFHPDLTDAINIMTHSELCPDGRPGYAVWNIYPPGSYETVKRFLGEDEVTDGETSDKIIEQKSFLSPSHRKRLYDKYGIRSWRIEQHPGEAVFIPAGCPHQVKIKFSSYRITSELTSLAV